MSEPDYIPMFAREERCSICGEPAHRKVEETIFPDDPTAFVHVDTDPPSRIPARHPLTAYVCFDHFREIMGPAANDR